MVSWSKDVQLIEFVGFVALSIDSNDHCVLFMLSNESKDAPRPRNAVDIQCIMLTT